MKNETEKKWVKKMHPCKSFPEIYSHSLMLFIKGCDGGYFFTVVCMRIIFFVSRGSVLRKKIEWVKLWISWNENYQFRSVWIMVLLQVSDSLFVLCQRGRGKCSHLFKTDFWRQMKNYFSKMMYRYVFFVMELLQGSKENRISFQLYP